MTSTTAARLEPLAAPYEPETARTLERLMGSTGIEPLKLFRTLAHNQELLDRFRSVGAYLLNFGTVEALERELVIQRVCARCGCEYEWGVHAAIYGSAVGLSEAQRIATVHGSDTDPAWSPRQSLLIRMVDELHETATVTPGLWEAMEREWDAEQLVELLALAGQYHLVSFVANAAGVEHEDFAAGFPPAPGA